MPIIENTIKIAYFSLEIGFSANVPSYSGGLGILAGDHIKSSADLGIPLCGVTLLYREGYMKQRLDVEGNQTAEYPRFNPGSLLEKLPINMNIKLMGKTIEIAVWRYIYVGLTGRKVPIYFLDTDIEGNSEQCRKITRRLYHGDQRQRIAQEAILGFGGYDLIQILEKEGMHDIETFHMNEGHAAFLTLAMKKHTGLSNDQIKKHFVFTIHTPVPAGHDVFHSALVKEILGDLIPEDLGHEVMNDSLNMTKLALYFCKKANGVSKLNGEVVRKMFPAEASKITHVTNGVHHLTWSMPPTMDLFDKYLPGWREDPETMLKEAGGIPDFAIWNTHQENKRRLLEYANSHKQVGYDPEVLTIVFARRAASYKRASLIFHDMDRLLKIAPGKIQIIFAGKAHPNDVKGQDIIRTIVERSEMLEDKVLITYLANYNMWLARHLCSGADVWLNTPLRPNEASGTSGMKAAINGILNLSIMDGWWAEGCRDRKNGWAIGGSEESNDDRDAGLLYDILEKEVIPTYYNKKKKWIGMMKQSIVTAASFVSQRMVIDYHDAYYHTSKSIHQKREKSQKIYTMP